MTRRSFWQRLPSVGFVSLLLVYGGLAVFLVWGLAKPPLERVWEIHHELKIGKMALLSPEDARLVQAALQRHPALADALLSEGKFGVISAHVAGWLDEPQATLIRAPDAPPQCRLDVELSGKLGKAALVARLEGPGWRREARIGGQPRAALSLPRPRGRGEVLSFVLDSSTPLPDLRVRLDPRCASQQAQPE